MYQAAGFRPARPLGHTALPGVLTLRLRLDAPARPLAWAAAATSALLFGGALGLGVAMDALAAALGVGCVGVSAVLAATLTTVFVAGTPAGWAAARFGTWRVAAAGTWWWPQWSTARLRPADSWVTDTAGGPTSTALHLVTPARALPGDE